MNLRPSGYEPDELPDCSTPHQEGGALYGPGAHPARLFGAPERERKMWRIDAILRQFAAYASYPSAARNLVAKLVAAP